ncbi:dynamin-related protein 1E-like protein [Tanacetum coccineum]
MIRILTLWDQAVMAMKVLEGIAYRLQHPWVGIVNRSQADINKNTGMMYAGKRSGSILLQVLNHVGDISCLMVLSRSVYPSDPFLFEHKNGRLCRSSVNDHPNSVIHPLLTIRKLVSKSIVMLSTSIEVSQVRPGLLLTAHLLLQQLKAASCYRNNQKWTCHLSGRRPIFDRFNLGMVNVNTSTVNHVTEKLYPGDPEFTLGELA